MCYNKYFDAWYLLELLILLALTLTDQALFPTLIDGEYFAPHLYLRNFISGSSCIFIEKNAFSSNGGQTAP